MYKKFLFPILALTLSTLACSININLPTIQPVGPTQVDDIALPLPAEEGTVHLSLSFGAGTLLLQPGTDSLVSGTASYNVEDFKPVVTMDGLSASIVQGDWKVKGIPSVSDIKNEWDLALGLVPMDLNIEAGAYKGEFELGGLAIENLTISDGASDVNLTFSQPNTTEMTLLKYKTGASNVSLIGLGNADFSTMEFESGAGNYTLDFSGALRRDGSVSIDTGVSNMTLVIPAGIPVQVTVDGGLSNVTFGSGWEKNGNVYTQEGSGPELTIVIGIGAGNLTLTH
jgi:hypothetical protein